VKPLVSLVIPMMNEAEGVDLLFAALMPVLESQPYTFEIVVVNDGSQDATLEKLKALQQRLTNLVVVDLSRNFGKEAALVAGFANTKGEAVITLDADLQDSPHLIGEMLVKWQEGYEVVSVVRKHRKEDTWLHRLNVGLFYRLINMVSEVKITPNIRDYRLMCREAVDAFVSLPERSRFNKGLFAWLGFKEYQISQELQDRAAGKTKWNFKKLLGLAINGVVSFSSAPLRIWCYVGFGTAFFAFIYGVWIVVSTLIFGVKTQGYPSMLAVILLFSGLNMLSVGILGEYIARIFNETKQRPLYLIRKIYRSQD
jgi:polyisoprenyl-phosphate glycosyltransferase